MFTVPESSARPPKCHSHLLSSAAIGSVSTPPTPGVCFLAGCRYGAPPRADRGPTHIDVFQDFQPPQAAAGQGAAAAGDSHAAAGQPSANALSNLFKPPAGLLFDGDFDAAKAHATDKGRWLLVNIQTADEFASHRLNRDTWGNDLVQDMVRESFVLWQVRGKPSMCEPCCDAKALS